MVVIITDWKGILEDLMTLGCCCLCFIILFITLLLGNFLWNSLLDFLSTPTGKVILIIALVVTGVLFVALLHSERKQKTAKLN